MKSGPLDQSRFKSGHQIGQTSRLKRRFDLGRRISAQQISATEVDSDISPIYLPKNLKKCLPRACLPRVEISTEISSRFRYFAEISAIFADFLRFFQKTTLCFKNRFVNTRYTKYRRYIGRYFRHFNPCIQPHFVDCRLVNKIMASTTIDHHDHCFIVGNASMEFHQVRISDTITS